MAHKTVSKPPAGDDASGHLTDAGARGLSKAIAATSADPGQVPGPSTNPATNLILFDILMRTGGRLMRHTVEKGVLAGRYGGQDAKKIIENRSVAQALVGSLVARLATRSVPGALLIGGGLVAKTLYDRGRSKRSSRRSGDAALRKMTKD